jgi:lipoyl(octanoyl) transferase
MKESWRLIDNGEGDGPSNMALDEALLHCFHPGESRPVLRLYGWNPPALSVGRYQDAPAALKLESCAEAGIAVVRRMTGGGIILHAGEVTYSIGCAPGQIGDAVGVKDGFRTLCSFLLATYRRLGLDAQFALDRNNAGERLGERTAFCFAGKEEYDVVVNGRKLGGNAQRRLRGAILQHGSIPLESQLGRAIPLLREPAPAAERSVSLAELEVGCDVGALKQMLIQSFEECLGVELRPSHLSLEEEQAAARLEATKYRCRSWNINGVEGDRR